MIKSNDIRAINRKYGSKTHLRKRAAKSNFGAANETKADGPLEVKESEPDTLASPEQAETTPKMPLRH